jgi:lipopolysaccharide-induced tumor necrosis factor-alpha factor
MHLLSSKRNSSVASVGLANQSRSPLNMHRTESLTPRRFSLGIISLSDRWSVPNFRRSSLSTHASPGVSMVQGAKEHEEGRSKRMTTTPPSSLRNQFKKFYSSSDTTSSTISIQTHNDYDARSNNTSKISDLTSVLQKKNVLVHANWQLEFPDEPIHVDCPHCHLQVKSVTARVTGRLIWVTSFVLVLSTIVLVCVPCCLSWLKDVQHRCPECNTVIGRYQRW